MMANDQCYGLGRVDVDNVVAVEIGHTEPARGDLAIDKRRRPV